MAPCDYFTDYFVPHCHLGKRAYVVAASPVITGDRQPNQCPSAVLLNLGHSCTPRGLSGLSGVIEVVGMDDEGRSWRRGRWKHYADRGYTITRHDLTWKTSH